jgi:hypothetical protein
MRFFWTISTVPLAGSKLSPVDMLHIQFPERLDHQGADLSFSALRLQQPFKFRKPFLEQPLLFLIQFHHPR